MRGLVRAVGALLPILATGGPTYPANPDDAKPVVALLGDSITAGNTPTSNGDINRGYWHWAQALSGFRAYCAAYAGIGGNVTAQMLARLTTDVITPLSAYVGRDRYCIVMGGVNDAANPADIVATATANLAAIYTALLAAGITPIAMTCTPTTSASSATQIANWNGINSWLRSYCPAHSIILCDNISDCLDGSFPVTSTPTWKANHTHDGVHPTAQGAQAIASSLAATLASELDAIDHFAAGTDTFAGRILPNHAMLGTGGTAIDGATGSVADNWRVSLGTAAKVARGDGVAGEWQALSIAPDAQSSLYPAGSIDITSGFAVGNLICCQAEVYCVDDWVDVTQFFLKLEYRNGSTILDGLTFLGNDPYTGEILNPAPDGTLVLRTIPTVVPASTNIIRVFLSLVGAAGTIRIGRFELIKLEPA
jgi:lysophospholipase L1-like esterase